MLLGKYRILTFFVFILIFKVSLLFAGTTGKISGRIVDSQTGEPLVGVNVMVVGTSLGAASDIDGYYVILNVQPGIHSVKASMVGYAAVTINDIRVRIDETSPVDIQLTTNILETESIVILADRNIIKRDVSTSVTALQPEEIKTLPVTSINQAIEIQAGIEDGLKVRGGGSNQLLFQIDGVTLRDPRNNQPITSIALSSIQEVSIERGGFNAEYGQVRSGVLNIVTKEGSASNYNGSIQVRYSSPQKKYLGLSVYDPNSMWNKPYLDPDVCWTGTTSGAWDLYTQRQYPQFEGWNKISDALLSDDDPTNDLSPAGAQALWEWQRRRRPSIEPDYTIDASFGGPIPIISQSLGNLRFFSSFRFEKEMLLIPLSRDDYQEYSGALKITSDIAPGMNLMLSGNLGRTYNVALNAGDRQFNNLAFGINGVQFWDPTNYMRSPLLIASITNEQRSSRIFTNSWYSQAVVDHISLAGKLTQFINPTSFYEVRAEFLNSKYKTGPIAARDTSKIYEPVPGYFVDEAPFGFDIHPYTGIGESGFFFGGHSATIRDTSKNSSFVINGAITSQITKEHLVKAGIEFAYYDLNLKYGEVNEFFSGRNYVNDVWNPFRISAYAQDKIEMLGFVANLGVRVDISNPNTEWVSVDPFNPYFSSSYSGDPNIQKLPAEVDVAFSPRLGISHPITEDSKIYFNYGHFKQLPAYEEIYRVGRAVNNQIQNYGNPNLTQARTISYELGYDHVLFEDYLVQISAFYNDVTDQQGFTQYVSDIGGIGYFAANNDGYADTRGIEISLKKTFGDYVRGFVNYTLQVKSSGAFGSKVINEDPYQQKLYNQNTENFYQDRQVPEPWAHASLTFFTPTEFGMWLGDWSANFLGTWRSGEYMTYNPINVKGLENNVQRTDYWNADLRLSKVINLNSFQVTLFMDITNLFNNKRLSGASFYDSYDQQFYFQSLHLPENDGYNNIHGDDKIGDYRKEGISFQPIEQVGNILDLNNPNLLSIYYETGTKRYMHFADGNWAEVDASKMQQILDDKAYIDMPNNSSFDFLNPRQIYFGINLTFNL